MTAWLTWKLFWKVAPYIGAVLALLGAVWYIDHRGYERAEQEAADREAERKADLAAFVVELGKSARSLEGTMQTAINASDAQLVNTLNGLELTNRTIIQPTLVKEIQSEARFSDPNAGITDGMLRELNRARGFSQRIPCPANSNAVACYSLPPVEPYNGQDDRNPGN